MTTEQASHKDERKGTKHKKRKHKNTNRNTENVFFLVEAPGTLS